MFTHRLATEADLDTLRSLMAAAIGSNQRDFLTPAQVAASRMLMGLDTQLVADRTYVIVECDGRVAGGGGWSYRAGVYGGDHSTALRDATPLDPATDPARIRAMYTHPDFVRRGIGRIVLSVCEAAARAAGFRNVVLMATLSGEPLYRAAGYVAVEHRADTVDGVEVPLIRMTKRIS
nr:GNAT family N-acetyltransferase [Polymorphobacter sp.]